MERYLGVFVMRMRVKRWLLNVKLSIYWILSSFTNFKCGRRNHIQEIELLFSTLMSPGVFPITIITKPFSPTCSHLGFWQMLDRSGSRSWRDWMSLGNHISKWNKSGFGALLSPDLVLRQLSQPRISINVLGHNMLTSDQIVSFRPLIKQLL